MAVAVVVVLTTARPTPSGRPRLVTATLYKGPSVSAMAQGYGGTWVTDDLTDRLLRLGAHGRTEASVHLQGRPVAMVLAAGHLWVAAMVSNTVQEFDLSSLHLVRTVTVPTGPSGLAALDGNVWVASLIANQITPIDTGSGRVGTALPMPAGAVRIAAGFGALWVTGTTHQLTEVQPNLDVTAVTHTITVGNGPIGVATGVGSVWVADATAGTVDQVSPSSHRVVRTFRVGGDPLALAVTAGRVWVADGSDQTLRTIFPAPGLAAAKLNSSPRQLLPVGRDIWVATANPGRVLQAKVSG